MGGGTLQRWPLGSRSGTFELPAKALLREGRTALGVDDPLERDLDPGEKIRPGPSGRGMTTQSRRLSYAGAYPPPGSGGSCRKLIDPVRSSAFHTAPPPGGSRSVTSPGPVPRRRRGVRALIAPVSTGPPHFQYAMLDPHQVDHSAPARVEERGLRDDRPDGPAGNDRRRRSRPGPGNRPRPTNRSRVGIRRSDNDGS